MNYYSQDIINVFGHGYNSSHCSLPTIKNFCDVLDKYNHLKNIKGIKYTYNSDPDYTIPIKWNGTVMWIRENGVVVIDVKKVQRLIAKRVRLNQKMNEFFSCLFLANEINAYNGYDFLNHLVTITRRAVKRHHLAWIDYISETDDSYIRTTKVDEDIYVRMLPESDAKEYTLLYRRIDQ